MADEKKTADDNVHAKINPNDRDALKRAADPMIRRNLGMEGAKDAEVFAEIRKRKDVS